MGRFTLAGTRRCAGRCDAGLPRWLAWRAARGGLRDGGARRRDLALVVGVRRRRRRDWRSRWSGSPLVGSLGSMAAALAGGTRRSFSGRRRRGQVGHFPGHVDGGAVVGFGCGDGSSLDVGGHGDVRPRPRSTPICIGSGPWWLRPPFMGAGLADPVAGRVPGESLGRRGGHSDGSAFGCCFPRWRLRRGTPFFYPSQELR